MPKFDIMGRATSSLTLAETPTAAHIDASTPNQIILPMAFQSNEDHR